MIDINIQLGWEPGKLFSILFSSLRGWQILWREWKAANTEPEAQSQMLKFCYDKVYQNQREQWAVKAQLIRTAITHIWKGFKIGRWTWRVFCCNICRQPVESALVTLGLGIFLSVSKNWGCSSKQAEHELRIWGGMFLGRGTHRHQGHRLGYQQWMLLKGTRYQQGSAPDLFWKQTLCAVGEGFKQTASCFPVRMGSTGKWEGGWFSSAKLLTRQPQQKGNEELFRGQAGYFISDFLRSRKLLGTGTG